MKFPLSKIHPNPFRDLNFNGYHDDTLQGLMASIRETGFWSNVVARAYEDGAEIAYGHHRIEAARRLYGPDYEVDLALVELEDRTMLKMMIAENIHQRGQAAANEFEVARALVSALADGRLTIELPEDTPQRKIRYAPSYVPPVAEEVTAGTPYTLDAIAEFFDWNARKVSYVFAALELDELGILPIDDLLGMSTFAVRQLVEATRARLKAAERAEVDAAEELRELEEQAAQAEPEESAVIVERVQIVKEARGKHLSRANRDVRETARVVKEKLDNKEITTRAIKDVAREIELKNNDKDYRPPPPAARYVRSHKRRVDTFFDGDRGREIESIVSASADIASLSVGSADQLVGLSNSLRSLAERAAAFADAIEDAVGDYVNDLPEDPASEVEEIEQESLVD